MKKTVLEKLQQAVLYAGQNSPFYRQIFQEKQTPWEAVFSMGDFENLPFTDKYDLRRAYPLGLQAVSSGEVVRIHSSSGTTGNPVIIPYTRKDVEDWAIMFARCYAMAGITKEDVIQITPGYGLWTAGIGFQAGAERLGAMAIPMGPGNTEKQLQMMQDLKSTVFCSTSSYALLIAEEVQKRGLSQKIFLKKGIIGSERWGDLMRCRISEELNIELFDIYGLTEVYGPGIGIDCTHHQGMHYWDDYLYFEIIDSETGKVLPVGETGELVITTYHKQAAPLIRYRTHDITRILPEICPCGCGFPMIDRIVGRTDEMTKVKGVNIFPGQVDCILRDVEGVSSEYQVIIQHTDGKDVLVLKVERKREGNKAEIREKIATYFKTRIGIRIEVEVLELGEIPRSEKKTKRIIDYREK